MSLLFNMRSRLVLSFLPRSKRLLISWLQSPSAVILEPKKNKACHCFHCFSIYLPWSDGTGAIILVFWMLSFKPTFSLSSFTFNKRLFRSFLISAIRVVVICISEVIDTSPGNLDSSLCFFQPSVSTYKLNKQGDNIQPWHTPFPIWNQSVVPCPVLTVASLPAYRFLKRQLRWTSIRISQNFPHFVVIHTVKRFDIVKKQK